VQNYSISPRRLDQHLVIHIRVCTVYTGDEFALDPLPQNKAKISYNLEGRERVIYWIQQDKHVLIDTIFKNPGGTKVPTI